MISAFLADSHSFVLNKNKIISALFFKYIILMKTKTYMYLTKAYQGKSIHLCKKKTETFSFVIFKMATMSIFKRGRFVEKSATFSIIYLQA